MVAEKTRELEEGEEPKSPSKIVADSLSQVTRSSTFLPNLGISKAKNATTSARAVEARLQAEFEATLQVEREEAARKQEELQEQLRTQHASLEENQNLLRQTQEEVKEMNNKFEETNSLLCAVLKLQKD
jgi:septal ring factor EnvC (AmiA/AmiB activator)